MYCFFRLKVKFECIKYKSVILMFSLHLLNVANISIRPGTNGYEDSNDVKYYRMLRNNPTVPPSSSGTPKDDIPF